MSGREEEPAPGNASATTSPDTARPNRGDGSPSGDSLFRAARPPNDVEASDMDDADDFTLGVLQLVTDPPPWRPLLDDYSSEGDEPMGTNNFTESIVVRAAMRGHLRQQSLERQALMDQLWAERNEEVNTLQDESDSDEYDDSDDDMNDVLRNLPNRPRIVWSAAEISTTERIDNSYDIRQRIREISSRYANEKIHLNYQPGQTYSEPLDLRFLGAQNLDIMEFPSFRNNLATASQLHGLLFLADGSMIKMYKVDEPSKILESTFVFSFDTKPDATTTHQIVGANWTNFPHYINHLITGIMDGSEYLITAADDGRVLVFGVSYLAKRYASALKMNENKSCDNRTPVTGSVQPLGAFQMAASAWGLAVHERLGLLAVSCNTAHVTVLNLKELLGGKGNTVLRYTSPRLGHNIPDVCFIDPTPEDVAKGLFRDEAFYVTCTSIRGDLVVWEFFTDSRLEQFYAETEGVEMHNSILPDGFQANQFEFEGEKHDPMFLKIPFEGGRWMIIRNIEEEGWTVNTVSEQDFKDVENFYELSGSEWLNENNVFRQLSVPLYTKYPIPGLNRDENGLPIQLNQQFYDFAMRFIHFTISTIPVSDFDSQSQIEGIRSRNDQQTLPLDKQRPALVEHYISSRNKSSTSSFEPSHTQVLLKDPPLSNRFVIVSSKKSLYLCRAENLLCNASVSDVFRRGTYVSSDSSSFDRINMVKVIPGVSAVITASQLGAVSVFRLVRYKSLFTLRQEYVFPVHEMLIHRTPVLRAIVGLAVTPVYDSSQTPATVDVYAVRTHRLTIIYKDGFLLSYDLKRLDQGNLDELIF